MDGPLSEGARALRSAMWALIVLWLVALGLAFAGVRGWIARDSIPWSLSLSAGSLLGAVYVGLKAHQQALVDRERTSRQAMIISIAAQLGKQDQATLERIAGKGGPAGEAARMIMAGRGSKTRAASANQSARM